MVALAEGRHEQAEELWGESLGMFEELGERLGAAECLEGLARAAALRGDVGRAARLRADAVSARQAIGTPAPPLFRTLLWRRAGVPDGIVTTEHFQGTVQ